MDDQSEPIRLPDDVLLLKLIKLRNEELEAINIECKTKLPKQSIQRLPRYMRRRAASNNPKRLPKVIQSRYLDGKRDKTSKVKELRRKQMKKHVNERKSKEQIARREVDANRTLLHIWFAKRFKLELIWSKSVPISNNTKNQRNLYKMAKSGVCFYYISSFLKVISVNYGDKQELIVNLIKGVVKKDVNTNCSIETTFHVLDGTTAIGYVSLIWDTNSNSVTIWMHRAATEFIVDLLTANGFEISDQDQLERFKLIGSDSRKTLSRIGFQDIDLEPLFTSSLGFVRVIKTTEKLSQDLESCSKPFCNNVIEAVLINTSTPTRTCVDLVVKKIAAKSVWNKLVTNRDHLVGGLRDLKMFYFHNSIPFFPFFGFYVTKVIDSTSKLTTWASSIYSEGQNYIVRDVVDLKTISNWDFSNFTGELLNYHSFVNVELLATGRGMPKQGDILCTPTENDIRKLEEDDPSEPKFSPVEENVNKVAANVQCSSRNVIGFVEFGEYCLESGRGKGLGLVRTNSLKDLSLLARTLTNQPLVLFRSRQCPTFRFASIKVLL